jgi:hypothetical protein
LTGERVVRRLAAILTADVAGYSRVMGRDENGTVAPLKAHRTERFLAAANALAGNIDEARRVMWRILQTDSVLRLSNFKTYASVRRPADIETMLEGLRLAGLPE